MGLENTCCTSCYSVFPLWHFHPCFSCSLDSLVQDLRCSQWWGFTVRLGLGHSVVWYMVMNVLEEHCGFAVTGSQNMDAVCPDRNLGTTSQTTHSHNLVTVILYGNILYFPCIVSLLKNNWMHVLGNKYEYTTLFYIICWFGQKYVAENRM
jgi:hypothetical protein